VQNDPIPDHSVFIAFAPKDDPKIAVAVYVEYAGFGGTWAAPIASLITEKYLTDSISNQRKEQRILDAVILDY
jgi:penicillin-binding protein 2